MFVISKNQEKKFDVKINIGPDVFLMACPLSASELQDINAQTVDKKKNFMTSEAYNVKERDRRIFHAGIGGWGGFVDDDGKPIPFNAANLDKFLSCREFSPALKDDLIEKLTNYIPPGVFKESDPQP